MGALEVEVARQGLDDILAFVEHAAHGNVVDVGVLQRIHLRALEGAHAALRRKHEDRHTAFAAQGVFRRRAGIARGGAQNIERLAALIEHVFEDLAKKLHGHVLEGQRGAFGQAQQRKTGAQWFDWRNLRKDIGGVGRARHAQQVVRRDVVDEQAQHLRGQVGVRQAAPRFQGIGIELRQGFGQAQAAVGRQAFEQDVAKGQGGHAAPGRAILQLRLSTRRRVTPERTNDSACMACKAVSTSPSRASCVRKMMSA
ncbi:hypothetical protein CCAE64S_00040 [Castellaniella caeni]